MALSAPLLAPEWVFSAFLRGERVRRAAQATLGSVKQARIGLCVDDAKDRAAGEADDEIADVEHGVWARGNVGRLGYSRDHC